MSQYTCSLYIATDHLNRMCHCRWINSAFFRHLDISRESRRTAKFKMTRKILTAIVQRLVNLVSLDISGHIMLDNGTVPHFEEAMGRPRWVTKSRSSLNVYKKKKRLKVFFVIYFQMNNELLNKPRFFSLSALSRARAASFLSRSWRGPCSFWACMTPPSVMWHTSLLIRYWLSIIVVVVVIIY